MTESMREGDTAAALRSRHPVRLRARAASAILMAAITALVVLMLGAPSARAVPTAIDVRVLASGAKFIGSSVGGATVLLHDARTGELLVEGVTAGGTGNTKRIMSEAHRRNRVLSTPDAAKFHAVLDIDSPREILVTARGPLGAPQAMAEASTRLWLLPGVDRTAGDGVLLELTGLIVAPVSPSFLSNATVGKTMPLDVRVMMLCGCPITPGGLWDADDFFVTVHILDPEGHERVMPLAPADRPSLFAGGFMPKTPGVYRLRWIALQKSIGNVGHALTTLIVRPSSGKSGKSSPSSP